MERVEFVFEGGSKADADTFMDQYREATMRTGGRDATLARMSIDTPFHPALFADRTVVITGAGRGIGRAVAEAFHACGADVIAHAGRERGDLTDGERLTWLAADFLQRDEQDRFAEIVLDRGDRVDVLVNNAGTMFGRFPAGSLSDADYDRVLELNQHAPVRLTRALLPALTRAGARHGAAIVNTVSISAATGGSPGSSIYSASKAFVSTWTRAMARELAPEGIRANAVSPGVIDTDFHQRYSSAEKLENTRRQIPLQRLGSAADCAPAYLFLASPALSGYITGQVVEINGGQR